jgi:hypothetical protein
MTIFRTEAPDVVPPNTRYWLLLFLVGVAGGVTWLVCELPRGLGGGPGGCLVAVGVLNILMRRRIGRIIIRRSHSMPSAVARFWESAGERGAQLLYVGIGTILILAGFVALAKSA